MFWRRDFQQTYQYYYRVLTQKKYCYLLFAFLLCTTIVTKRRNVIHVHVLEEGGHTLSSDNRKYLDVFPGRQFRDSKIKHVLLWNGHGHIFWRPDPFKECAINNCMLTHDKNDIEKADAVIISDVPYKYPTYRANHQIWILTNLEPPYNYFTFLHRLNGIFNWTMTYRSDSDVHAPYYNLVKRENVKKSGRKPPDYIIYSRQPKKTRGIFWISSNYFSHLRRHRIVAELQKYIKVDTYGSCGELACPGNQCLPVLDSYKFKIAIESGSCSDYITEKPFQALEASTIPIVYGGANYTKYLPPGSYISMHDFRNFRDLADYIQKVDENETLYKSFFEWRNQYVMTDITKASCHLCEALNDKNRPAQVYRDMKGWFEDKDKGGYCKQLSLYSWASNLFDYILFKLGM